MMEDRRLVPWFITGLILLILLAIYSPKFAGGVTILLAIALLFRAQEKHLI